MNPFHRTRKVTSLSALILIIVCTSQAISGKSAASVEEAPVLSNIESNDLEYSPGDGEVTVTKTISISDKDSWFRIAYGATGSAWNNDGIAFDNFWIGERNRMALIEHFTNSSDELSAVADSILDSFADNYDMNVIDLQYHTSSPTGDPFYENNPIIPTTRQFYYGLSGVPYSVLNGGTSSQYLFDYHENSKPFNKNAAIIESLRDSDFALNINSQINDNQLHTEAEISALQDIPLTEFSVHIAVIERIIEDVAGENGDTLFRNVVKAMLPGAAGTTIHKAWYKGEYSYIHQTWELENVYDPYELRVAAFLQNESTFEVLQAALDTIGVINGVYNPSVQDRLLNNSYMIYPNPVSSKIFVEFTEGIEEDVILQLFNNVGKQVYTQLLSHEASLFEIPVDEWPGGLYLLKLSTSKKLLGINKVVINNP